MSLRFSLSEGPQTGGDTMTIKHGALAPKDDHALTLERERAPKLAEPFSHSPSPIHSLNARSRVPTQYEVAPPSGDKIDHSSTTLVAHYQRLPETSSVHKFVAARLAMLLTDIKIDQKPELIILARKGMGINACVTSGAAIVISPEMLSFLRYVEELDFVLLHEVMHLAHGHLKNIEATDSVKRQMGESRVSEYDADLEAFHALAHPARGSSPMGAISALERFRELAPTAWDIEHGTLIDRIMNLKTFTLFRDLSAEGAVAGECGSLSKPLRAIPAFIARELEPLGNGSRVESLLQSPPLDRGYDSYREQLREAVAASEMSSLRWTIPKLMGDLETQRRMVTELSSSKGAQFRLDSYTEVTQMTFAKLFQEVSEKASAHGLSPDAERQLLGVELLLAGMTPDRVKGSLIGPLQKRAVMALQGFSNNLSSTEDLNQAINLLSLVEGNIAYEQARDFIHEIARISLVDNCVFDRDEDDSIDCDTYLSHMHSIVEALAPRTLGGPSGNLEDTQGTLHAQAFLHLAAHLTDIDSSQCDETVRLINERKSPFLTQPASVSTALEFVTKRIPDKNLASKLQHFTRSKLKLLSLDDSQAEFRATLLKAQPLIQKVAHPEEADAALDEIQKLFQEAYLVARQLPSAVDRSSISWLNDAEKRMSMPLTRLALAEKIYLTEIQGSAVVMENATFKHAARLMTLEAGLFHALCENAKQRDQISSNIDDGLRLKAPCFEDLVHLMNELRSERPEALIKQEPIPVRQGDPHSEVGLHEAIFKSLCAEILDTPCSSQKVLERLSTFVTLTAIVKPDEESRHSEVLKVGEQALREVYPEDRSSEQFLKHALAVSFFDPNQVSARPIQRAIILRLVETAGALRAAHELFENLNPQRQWHNLETLEKLDETAITVHEIKTVAKLSKEHFLQADRLADRAGKLVIGDLILSKAARWDSFEFLFTGLSSAQDDRDLTEMVSQRWWDAQRDTLVHPLRTEQLPERHEYRRGEESEDRTEDFVDQVTHLTPATFTSKGDFDESELGSPETITANAVRQGLYGLGIGERLMVLRKLANDPARGVLISPERRVQVADGLLNMMLTSSPSDTLTNLSSQAFRALFRAVPADDLGIALTPMLLDHFLRAPRVSASFKPFASQAAHRFLEELGWDESKCPRQAPPDPSSVKATHYRLHEEISRHFEWALSGRHRKTQRSVSESTDNLMEMCGIVLSDHKSLSRRGPIPFILDFSRNLQTPGTRALQLLGGIVELPPEIEKEFLQVYDARKGQSKQSALNTVEKSLPQYAASLDSMKRIGGGALYSVFLVELKNGKQEVIRVANPNPEYHTKRILHSMRAAQAQLEKEDEVFAIGAHVINLVDEWISTELKDAEYERDDVQFRKHWNNWKPSRKCPLSIHIPHSTPTSTLLVRREEFIPGRNFTELEEIARENPTMAKSAVALALQHYIAQIEGSIFNMGPTLVHSDISPGNLRLMDGGKVAILDRSMYLKLTVQDRLILKQIRKAKSNEAVASLLVEGLSKLQGRPVSSSEQARITARVTEALNGKTSDGNTFLKGFLAAQQEGLMVPLRFQLLVKNFNSFRVMAQKVGFASLKEAQDYEW